MTVNGGSSTFSGTLSMTGGSLVASGIGTSLTASGTTTIAAAYLIAQGGATLSLPGLTNYSSNGAYFQATGANSVLDVSALTTVTQQMPGPFTPRTAAR